MDHYIGISASNGPPTWDQPPGIRHKAREISWFSSALNSTNCTRWRGSLALPPAARGLPQKGGETIGSDNRMRLRLLL